MIPLGTYSELQPFCFSEKKTFFNKSHKFSMISHAFTLISRKIEL
jgi:hypothetical protein